MSYSRVTRHEPDDHMTQMLFGCESFFAFLFVRLLHAIRYFYYYFFFGNNNNNNNNSHCSMGVDPCGP